MANYWLHRISWEKDISYPLLLNYSYLTIGWRGLAVDVSEDFLSLVRTNKSDLFRQKIDAIYGKEHSKWSLWRFASFQAGDFIVVPLDDGKFTICVVEEPAKPVNNLEIAKFYKSSIIQPENLSNDLPKASLSVRVIIPSYTI